MPPEKAKTRLRNLTVKEVSLVASPDNPPARVLLFKALHDPEEDARRIEEEEKGLSPAERRKRARIRAERDGKRQPGKVAKELYTRALQKLVEVLGHAPSDELRSELFDDVTAFALDADHNPAGPARTPEGPNMADKTFDEIVAALPDAERGAVQKVLDTQAAELKKQTDALAVSAAEVERLTPEEDEDPLKGVPEPVRKMIAEQASTFEKRDAENKVKILKLETERDRATFAKTLDELDSLAGTQEEYVDLLFDVPAEKRDKLVAAFKAANSAARLGILTPLGSDRGADEGSALGQIEAIAKEIQKLDPTKTIEQARVTAYERNPQLYHEAGQSGQRH